jgi:hypothetical protein
MRRPPARRTARPHGSLSRRRPRPEARTRSRKQSACRRSQPRASTSCGRLRVDHGVCTRPAANRSVPTAVRRRPPPGREHRLGRPARALADSRHVIGGRAPANRRSASSRRLRSVAILRVPRKTSTAPYASSGAADPKEEECFPSIPTRPVVRSAPSTCDAATSTAHQFTSASGRLMFVGRTSRAPPATGEPPKPAKTRV